MKFHPVSSPRQHRAGAVRGGAVLAAVLLALGATAGCSGDEGAPPVSATSPTAPVLQPGKPGEANASLTGSAALPSRTFAPTEADVRFMQDMIVHHAQAIVLVSLASEQLTDTQVKALAARISDEQRPEIDAMAKWLRSKGEQVPPQAGNPELGSGHDHAGMPGMATQDQLRQLKEARGVAADRLWLTLMTAHHQGALQMVVQHHRSGTDDVVTQLGDEIHVTQSVQIGAMRDMLARLT
ncbi:Uncharacterized conserved protein, DUF305 family [Pedococcus dokdonensis]|uniref:Uncharacterized conserved protein, DUF305 family n=1 Tax=Pedococcus dokdonensis TaxID=443156 RepID=A0A1H0UWQ7_9MICO|nr:DUF305 domain-containing protein [Pedococcus dokdonensis]SDP70236.1 Uncharacterized conserved protein, DUF305 family [Pedococcus dokdonensis]